jgi:hypothetical protein
MLLTATQVARPSTSVQTSSYSLLRSRVLVNPIGSGLCQPGESCVLQSLLALDACKSQKIDIVRG